MPYKTHTEHYFATETLPDRRTQTGFRIEEVKYYAVIEEDDYGRRKEVRNGFTSAFTAETYVEGWNDCLNAALIEREAS
jgi:hypothetical protein